MWGVRVFPDSIDQYTEFCMLLGTAVVKVRHDQNVGNIFFLFVVIGKKKYLFQISFSTLQSCLLVHVKSGLVRCF